MQHFVGWAEGQTRFIMGDTEIMFEILMCEVDLPYILTVLRLLGKQNQSSVSLPSKCEHFPHTTVK